MFIFLLQFRSTGKRLGDDFSHETINVSAGIETDRFHLVRVGLAVCHCRLFNGAVDDFADDVAFAFVHRYELTFQNKRQFVDNRRVDELAFNGREAAFRNFIRGFISAYNAKIVARFDRRSGSKSDCKRLFGGDVCPRFVSDINADGNLVFQSNSPPGGIHNVWRSVLVIRADYQYRHGEHQILHSEVFLHFVNPFLSVSVLPGILFTIDFKKIEFF